MTKADMTQVTKVRVETKGGDDTANRTLSLVRVSSWPTKKKKKLNKTQTKK